MAKAVMLSKGWVAPGTGGPLGVSWPHLTNQIHDSSFQGQELERATVPFRERGRSFLVEINMEKGILNPGIKDDSC